MRNRFFFWLAFPFILGILWADASGADIRGLERDACIAVSLCVLPLLAGWRYKPFSRLSRFRLVGCMGLFMVLLGVWAFRDSCRAVRYEWPAEPQAYQGVIAEVPQQTDKAYLCRMRIDTRLSAGHLLPVHRMVWARIARDSLSARLQCGDRIHLYARIYPTGPTDDYIGFDYAAYLFRHRMGGTVSVYSGYWQKRAGREPLSLRQKAEQCREKILDTYRRWGLAGDELAVLSALTVGDKDDLSDRLQQAYRTAGVSHVLALSGMHVAILWGLLAWVMRPLRRTRMLRVVRCVVLVGALWGFAFLVGLSPSVVRAVIICMLVTVAGLTEARRFPMDWVGAAAFLMLLYNPFYLFDVGFQLSFLAVLAMLWGFSAFYGMCTFSRPAARYVWGVVSASLAAQLGTSPLVAYYFSYFPIHFLWANLLVAPLLPLIIYGTLVTFALTPCAGIQHWAVQGLDGLLWMLNRVALWVERLPLADWGKVHLTAIQVWVLYGCLALLLGCVWKRSHKWAIPLLIGMNLFLITCLHRVMSGGEPPQMYLSHSQIKVNPPSALWQRDGLYVCRGVTVCQVADNRWIDQEAGHALAVDYLYLCRGYWGTVASLQRLFRVRKVVLDASLSAGRRRELKSECERLGLEYIDLWGKGSCRIIL